jgi:SAM-dependent methyltransferase
VSEGYRPAEYWSERLAGQYDLRGTGHLSYSRGYNDWLYRAKKRALRKALAGVRPGSAALDLGSGTGWVVQELLTAGMAVEGCDIAELAVERLSSQFPQAAFFQVTLGADPLPRADSSYDLVTALDVMYHVTDDAAWRAALAEAARVLRPGGLLVISDGLGDGDVEPSAHVRFRSLPRWTEAAAELGLQRQRLDPYFRWLSRDPGTGRLARRIPDGLRGAGEYALETLAPREPHMRLAAFSRQSSSR